MISESVQRQPDFGRNYDSQAQSPDARDSAASQKRCRTLLLVVLASASIIFIALALDNNVQSLVPLHPGFPGRVLASQMSRYCNLPFLLLYAFLILACGVLWKRRRWAKLGLVLILSSCLSGIVCTSIRATTGRTRPCAQVPQGWYGLRHNSKWLVGIYDYNSFPSGHESTAAGFGAVLLFACRRRRFKVIGLLLIGMMAWSRVFLRYHHFSDVVAAGVVGSLVAYYSWYWLAPLLYDKGACWFARGCILPQTRPISELLE